MRKILLGSTALVAAGLAAGSASAQTSEPIKMRISGYYIAAAGYILNQSDSAGTFAGSGAASVAAFNSNVAQSIPASIGVPAGPGIAGANRQLANDAGFGRRQENFKQDTEVHFLGETKLDNGLIVGVHFEFEGQTQQNAQCTAIPCAATGDNVDETWMYFKGNWGELRFGDEDDVRRLKTYTAPTVGGNIFGLNEPFIQFSNNPIGSLTTQAQIDNDSTKVLYFTPSIAGFQAAFSYAPSGTQDRRNNSFGGAGTNASSTQLTAGETAFNAINQPCPGAGSGTRGCVDEAWSAAFTYDAKFGDFTVGVGGGYSTGAVNSTLAGFTKNVEAIGASTLIGFGPFQVGGGVLKGKNFQGNGEDANVANLGIKYTIGPFEVALEGMYGEFDQPSDGSNPGTTTASRAHPAMTQGLLSVGYNLGPGIWIAAGLYQDHYGRGGMTAGAVRAYTMTGSGYTSSSLNGARNYDSTSIMVGTRVNF